MSTAIFALLMFGLLIVLARKTSGGITIAVVGLLCGVIIASSSGPLGVAAKQANASLRNGVASIATSAFGG